ncbi:MAG: acyltransferase family protein [Ruminococcus sp.]
MGLINVQTSKRIEWIDTAKGIGLILVVLGHLKTPYISTWIYTFHMPLFFFLSGVVFSGEKYSFKEFLVKRIKSLVIPYFSLGFVIWLFYVIVNIFVDPEESLYGSNLSMLINFFIQEHFWTVWFLACLFLTEMIYFILVKCLRNNILFLSVASVIICSFGLIRYRLGYGGLPWNLDVALVAQFFLHFGYILKNSDRLKSFVLGNSRLPYIIKSLAFLAINLLAGILCIKLSHESLDMSVGLYGNELLTIISALSGTLFVVILSEKIHSKFITYLGQNTMIIFAWHSRIVIVLCKYIYKAVGIFQTESIIDKILYTLVTSVIIFIILIPVNELIKRSKIHKIFGV